MEIEGKGLYAKFLELMKLGFVEAEEIPNVEEIDHPVFSAMVDSRRDRLTQRHVHAFLAFVFQATMVRHYMYL